RKEGGWAGGVHVSNVMTTPIEVLEGEYPIVVEEQALRPGSGGDGAHRGGLGFRRCYRVLAPDVTLTSMIERRVVPPYGLAGGKGGAPLRLTLNPRTPRESAAQGKETVRPCRGRSRRHRNLWRGRLRQPRRPFPRAHGPGPTGRISRMKLADRNALVTGAAKGMGWEICTTLAREGANVALTARDVQPLETL